MNEVLSDFCNWVSDMKDNPEIIGSELANVGGKIGRGVAALVGGTVEAVGAVGAARTAGRPVLLAAFHWIISFG